MAPAPRPDPIVQIGADMNDILLTPSAPGLTEDQLDSLLGESVTVSIVRATSADEVRSHTGVLISLHTNRFVTDLTFEGGSTVSTDELGDGDQRRIQGNFSFD